MKRTIRFGIFLLTLVFTRVSAQTITHSWDFTGTISNNQVEGWRINYYGSASTSNSLLTLTIPNPPSASSPHIINYLSSTINASVSKYVYIRLRNNTNETKLKFNWYTNSTWYNVEVPIGANDTDLKEYYIDLSNNANWTGTVSIISFMLPSTLSTASYGKTFLVDYIKSISKAPMVSKTPAPFGVNLSGAEFGAPSYPGVLGTNYGYPTSADFDYFYSKNLKLIRFPFRWERIQRTLNGPLYQDELLLMKTFIQAARARGMWVILDLHNSCRRYSNGVLDTIGTSTLTISHVSDLWYKLAAEFKNYDNIYGYGIMNEPHHQLPSTPWINIAQPIINSIRTIDTATTIIVGGDDFSSARNWVAASDNLKNLSDPSNNLMYEAHVYFDNNTSGAYSGTYDAEKGRVNTGVARVAPFVKWLKANNKTGFVGEYGIPDNDTRWNTTLDNALFFLKENGVSGTYWSAGPRWGTYPLSVQPANGADRPQMAVLQNYAVADAYNTTLKDSRQLMHFWDFNGPVVTNNWIDDWNINDYTNPSSSGGYLYLTHSKAFSVLNYYWQATQLAIDPTVHKYAVVKVKNTTAYTTGKFGWKSNGTTYSVSFPISANDTSFKQYVVDLGSNANWTGNISFLSVAVPNLSTIPTVSASVVFDEIKLTMSAPASGLMALGTDMPSTSLQDNSLTLTSSGLSLIPNPVESSVRLTLPGNPINLQLSVVAINGQTILKAKGKIEELNQAVNAKISSLAPGVYLVQVLDNGKVYQSKLLKK